MGILPVQAGSLPHKSNQIAILTTLTHPFRVQTKTTNFKVPSLIGLIIAGSKR
jgi:hypothetical protein